MAAQQCGIQYTIMNDLVGGLLGSLGFFINMFIVSGAIYLYKKHKSGPSTDAAKKVAADILARANAAANT